MKKIILMIIPFVMLLTGCSTKADSIFTDSELDVLDAYGLVKKVKNDCDNPITVKKMLKNNFIKSNVSTYCDLKVDSVDGLNQLISNNVSNKEIEEYLSIPYFKSEKINRYLKYDAKTVKEKVLNVNMNLDLLPFKDAKVLTSIDKTTLINKYNKINENYTPNNLVSVSSKYTGKNIKLNKEAYNEFQLLAKDAKEKNIDLKITNGYLNYSQQKLFEISSSIGKEQIFLAGYNEHGTGFAIDIELNNLKGNNIIKDKKAYNWLSKNLYKYGFIIRYKNEYKNETLYDGIPYHIRYVGLDLAEKLYKENISLERYYGTK